jgi:hypothetical protein
VLLSSVVIGYKTKLSAITLYPPLTCITLHGCWCRYCSDDGALLVERHMLNPCFTPSAHCLTPHMGSGAAIDLIHRTFYHSPHVLSLQELSSCAW